MGSRVASGPGVRVVRESRAEGDVPLHVHPDWSARFPWLVQGTTGRGGDPDEPFDLGLFGDASVGRVLDRWRALRARTGCVAAVHARQVHGASVRWHDADVEGLLVGGCDDGHATARPGVLLAVSIADCVPVSVIDPAARAIALLHAGWRGAAAGVLEEGLRLLAERTGAESGRLWLHLGPAICGGCYEVGPEVHEALGRPRPKRPATVDLRAVLAGRAVAAGVSPGRVTVSALCTRCGGEGDPAFFSHRGGDRGRQMAVLAIGRRSGADVGTAAAQPAAGRPVREA